MRYSSFSSNVEITETRGSVVFEESNFNDHLVDIRDCKDGIVDVLNCQNLHLALADCDGVSVEGCTGLQGLTITQCTTGYMVKNCRIEGDVHCSGNAITSSIFCETSFEEKSGGQCEVTHDICPV